MAGRLLNKTVEWVLIILMGVMVLDVTWQVFTRFILRDPSSFTEELATFLLIWIGLLGAAYAYRTRSHLGIDILLRSIHGRRHLLLDNLIQIIVILFCGIVMLIGGWKLVMLTFELEQVSAAMGIPMGIVYLVIPMSGLLIVGYAIEIIFINSRWLKQSGGQDDPDSWIMTQLEERADHLSAGGAA